jgi:hypothetical protein
VISSDGGIVVFTSFANLTGQNPDGSAEVFQVRPDGTGLVQLTTSPTHDSAYPRVDGTGTWTTFVSNADLGGGNADHSYEVFRMRTDGTGLQQLTADAAPDAFSYYPDISGAGDRVVYQSNNDPLGTNPERNLELFLWDQPSSTTRQLTTTAEGDSYYPRITEDGAYVYFTSDAPLTESASEGVYHGYRLALAGGPVERVEGLNFQAHFNTYSIYPIEVDGTGAIAVLSTQGNFTGQNPDLLLEVWVLDRATAPSIQISPGEAPTLVSWDVESGPIRYDVIRGDVASLQFSGGTVDLGTVVCLEDDSPDATAAGFEDTITPGLGQAFFYLYRGSQGIDAGPGSWGPASNGAERVAGAGSCSDAP